MPQKTRTVTRKRPINRYNPTTGDYELAYEDYTTTETYWEADTTNSSSYDSGYTGGSSE